LNCVIGVVRSRSCGQQQKALSDHLFLLSHLHALVKNGSLTNGLSVGGGESGWTEPHKEIRRMGGRRELVFVSGPNAKPPFTTDGTTKKEKKKTRRAKIV
jgi:hypothetical protein